MNIFDSSCPWQKGNLHTHTTLSDGRKTVEEAIALYRGQGYDFLAITDHRGDTAEASEENSLSEEQLHSDLDAPPRDTAEGDPPVSEPQIADFDPCDH